MRSADADAVGIADQQHLVEVDAIPGRTLEPFHGEGGAWADPVLFTTGPYYSVCHGRSLKLAHAAGAHPQVNYGVVRARGAWQIADRRAW